jgi:protoheme IX farnesyltransferase
MAILRPHRLRLLQQLDAYTVCAPCLRRLASSASARAFSRAARNSEAIVLQRGHEALVGKKYFLANETWTRFADRGARRDGHSGGVASATAIKAAPLGRQPDTAKTIQDTVLEEKDTTLPHRRRKRKQQDEDTHEIPLDASSQLSTMSSALPTQSMKARFFTYLALSKPRLSFLVVLTTTAAYSLFPVAATPLSSTMSLSPLTLLNLTTGTALCCASANALNMLIEPAHDAKMTRTRNRPLVRGLLTPRAAFIFAVATGLVGVTLLDFGVNPTCAFLGGLNIVLYAGAYTPLKRISVINTWVGALVGGIPPLMGWVAAAGQAKAAASATGEQPGWQELLFDPATSAGGWLVAALLFAWQFPHFNSLSWTIRQEYANAGYRMLASINPRRNGLVGLRYALLMVPICAGLSYVGVTGWSFVATSGIVNAWMIREAWRFYRLEGAKGSARGLFWASVWHLPLVLVLAMVQKRGLWDRLTGKALLDEEVWEEYHPDEADVPASNLNTPLA